MGCGSSGAAAAAAAHAYRHASSVCVFDATKIGISRYRTTMPITDHTACTIAEAAGGATAAVPVAHECSGQNARRPATPTNSRTDPTTSDLTVHPGFVCRIGSSVLRFCNPYRE